VSDGGEDQGADEACMGQKKKAKNRHVSFGKSRLALAAPPFQGAMGLWELGLGLGLRLGLRRNSTLTYLHGTHQPPESRDADHCVHLPRHTQPPTPAHFNTQEDPNNATDRRSLHSKRDLDRARPRLS